MRTSFLPALNDARRAWLTNFSNKLGDSGNGYATKYAITAPCS